MCFSIRKKVRKKFHNTIDTKEIEGLNEFKYLGVVLDPQLNFDAQANSNRLSCFKLIRSYLSFEAAHLYLHAMVLSHLSCSVTA